MNRFYCFGLVGLLLIFLAGCAAPRGYCPHQYADSAVSGNEVLHEDFQRPVCPGYQPAYRSLPYKVHHWDLRCSPRPADFRFKKPEPGRWYPRYYGPVRHWRGCW